MSILCAALIAAGRHTADAAAEADLFTVKWHYPHNKVDRRSTTRRCGTDAACFP